MASGFLPTAEGFVPSSSGSGLYYRRLGRGPQTVVIPLATWWGSQADTLADRMEVVLYECPARFFAAVGEFLDGHWPGESEERPQR